MRENDYNILYCNYTVGETKKYLHQVVEKRYKEDLQQVLEALDMADYDHKSQLRDNDAPFIIHPIRVALMLLEFDKNINSKVFVASLLHDTVEKTGITLSDIEICFGKYVAKLV